MDPAVRRHYAHKSRVVRRAAEEHVPLPDDFAPPVVTPEAAERIHRLASLNKWLATPQNPDPQELLRGIAKCGYCQNRLIVGRVRRLHADGTPAPRSTYKCGKGTHIADACGHHGIEAHKLDAAVWAAFSAELRNPVRIRAEVERMREAGDPSAATVEAIGRNLAEVRRQIANRRKYIDVATSYREIEEVNAEVTALRIRERTLEAERAATFADWQATQDGLERILDWCERVSGNLDRFTFAERRETLLTLKAEVLLYKADRYPRVELAFSLPLSGALPLAAGVDAGVMVQSTSRQ